MFTQKHTCRGFELIQFKDSYGNVCSIQESSAAPVQEDDGSIKEPNGWIWLGLDCGDPKIMVSDAMKLGVHIPNGETSGWIQYLIPEEVLISTRMHLNAAQVKELVGVLSRWLKTGSIHK